MAVVIYARKSTENEDRQVQSLEDQLKELERLAEQTGVLVAERIVESKSAKEPYTRPEFQRLVGMIEEGKVTGLLTWHTNRLSRNMVDGGIIAHLLQQGKLEFILTPQRKYLPQDSALLLAIENGMATSFIQDLRRAVKRGMKGKVERGWLPGPAPLGYRNNRLDKTIEPDPERFDLVRKGWELVLHGRHNVAEVGRAWAEMGLTSPAKGRTMRPVSTPVLYKLFANPFYAGQIRYGGEVVQGAHRPMVTREEFDRVQYILNTSAKRKLRVRLQTFSGLFWCPVCGCQIVGETKRKRYATTGHEVSYTYYHCSGFKGCPKTGFRESDLLEATSKEMRRVALPSAFVAWARDQILERSEQESKLSAVSDSALERQLQSARDRLSRIRELRIEGELGADEYAALRKKVDEEIAELENKKTQSAHSSERAKAFVLERLDAAEKAGRFDEIETEFKRGIVASIAERAYLTLEGPTFDYDPVIQKLATFEPLECGSQSSKSSGLSDDFTRWYPLIDDICNLAQECIDRP